MQTSPRQEVERYLRTGEHYLSRSSPGEIVASDYFHAPSRFDAVVVHEAAHSFHSGKRRTIGLSATPRRAWPLEIDCRKRATFAYACESYSRMLELGNSFAARHGLLSEIEEGPVPPDDRVGPDGYIDILRAAVADRNGWRRILRRCSPAPARRRREVGAKR